MIKRVLPAALLMLLVAGGLFVWRQARTAPSALTAFPPTLVSAMTVEPRSVPNALSAIGALQPVQGVTLAPEAAGRVVAIRFEAGQQVKAGTPLVQLFDAPERASLADARARADFARIQLTRSTSLASSGAEPKELREQRQSELARANAAVAQFEAQIVQKSVVAPFDGEIGIRRINLGQVLNAGEAIATLTRLDPLYVNFTLPQQDLSALQIGATVEVTSDSYPDRSFTGQITTIEPVVGSDTRNVTVQATLANPDHALRPGMYVTAHVVLPRQTALVVPATAILTSASGDSVVVVRGPDAQHDGKAQIIPVQIGRRIGDDVIVEQGLEPGDVVVTAGQLRVQPDTMVKVSPASVVPQH